MSSRSRTSRERGNAWKQQHQQSGSTEIVCANAAGGKLNDDPVVRIDNMMQTGSIRGLTPETLGNYLGEFYQGRYANIARIWEVMENRDDTLAPMKHDKRFGKIKKELSNYEIIIPGYDAMTPQLKARAEKHAALLEDVYANLRAQHAVRKHIRGGDDLASEYILEALLQQFSLTAKVWNYGFDNRLRLNLKFVPLYYFQINADNELYFVPDGARQLPVSGDQFIVASRSRAIMEAVSVLVLFKRLPLRQLVRVLEKFGIPNVHGETTEQKGSEGWKNLYSAVKAYQADMAAVISSGDQIVMDKMEFRSSNLHRPFLDLMNRLITINVVGGDLGSMAQAGTGTLAGNAQADDTDDIIAADCKWYSDVCKTQIDDQAVYLEFGDEMALAHYYAYKPDAEDDRLALAVIKTLVNLGVNDISKQWAHERFNIPVAEAGEESLEVINPYDALTTSAAEDKKAAEESGSAGDGETGNAAPSNAIAAPRATISGRLPAVRANSVSLRQLQARGNAAKGAKVADCACTNRILARGNAATRAVQSAQNDVDTLFANSMQPLGNAYAALWQPLFDQMAGASNLTVADAYARQYQPAQELTDAFAEVAAQMVFAAVMRGYVPMRSGIQVANAAPAKRWNPLAWIRGNAEAALELQPLPFEEAEEFWRNKSLVTSWDEVGAATYEQAVVLGFKIAGITQQTVLQQIWDRVNDAIMGGMTVKELADELVESYGLNAKHAETVARTNIQSAYQWGHYQQLTLPAVSQAFSVWGYLVVLDDRTTDICAGLAGKSFLATSNVHDSLYPPNHYNCRTTIFPIQDGAEAAQLGFTMTDSWPVYPPGHRSAGAPVLPSQGFESNIGTVPLGSILG